MTTPARSRALYWYPCITMFSAALALGCGASPMGDESPGGDASAEAGESLASSTQALTEDAACPDVGLDASKVYYVCDCQEGAAPGCQAGNDANPGTQSAPWRSYAKARSAFGALRPGETIAFCRGGSFTIDGDRRWVNPSCRADAPCVVRDYTPSSGATAKPILTAWSGDGFAFEDGGAADHEEGYTFLNLDIRSRTGGQSGNGFFIYNDVDDVLVCGVSITGFGIGFHSAGSNGPAPGSDGKNSRVVLKSSYIANNGDQGYLGGCDGCGVAYSTFENNGFKRTMLNHNIYFSPRGADGMFAIHNDLYRSAIVGGQCEGVSLVVHGQLSNLRIENNVVREDVGRAGVGCWGIAVDTGYVGEGEAFRNVSIRNNTVLNVGNVGIGLNACQGCVVENNVVVQTQPMDSTLIAVPNRSRGGEDLAMGGVTVRNNTLFAQSPNRITGIALGGEGSGHVSVSNALLSVGPGPFTCFSYGLGHDRYAVRDRNLCYATGGGFTWANSSTSLAAWRVASGADRASYNADPRFVSTTAPYDFTPGPRSPLVNRGHASSSETDLNGIARDSKPDIGAIER